MDLGGYTHGARALALDGWAHGIGDALTSIGRAEGPRFVPLTDAASVLARTDETLVRAAGWEMHDLLRPVYDSACIERADFNAMSVAQRAAGGSIEDAVRNLAGPEGRFAGRIVVHDAKWGPFRLNIHGAEVSRVADDRLLAIDHLVADGPDGVIGVEEWLRRIKSTPDSARITSSLHRAPSSFERRAGIPPLTPQLTQEQWITNSRALASTAERA